MIGVTTAWVAVLKDHSTGHSTELDTKKFQDQSLKTESKEVLAAVWSREKQFPTQTFSP